MRKLFVKNGGATALSRFVKIEFLLKIRQANLLNLCKAVFVDWS